MGIHRPGEGGPQPLNAGLDLSGVSAELLARVTGTRVHQVGATTLDDVAPLDALRGKRGVGARCRDQLRDRRLGRGDVEWRSGTCRWTTATCSRRRWCTVTPWDAAIDAITLVGVHVGTGARPGLEHVDGELVVVLARRDLAGRGDDRGGLPSEGDRALRFTSAHAALAGPSPGSGCVRADGS